MVNDGRKVSWTAVIVHSIHQAVQNRPWRELTGKKISFSFEWWWRLEATCYIYFRIPTSVARCKLLLMYKPMKGECYDSANRPEAGSGIIFQESGSCNISWVIAWKEAAHHCLLVFFRVLTSPRVGFQGISVFPCNAKATEKCGPDRGNCHDNLN